MPQLDPAFAALLAADPAALVPAALLVAIIAVHLAYYRLHLGKDCQQVIEIDDLAGEPSLAAGTVVRAPGTEFDARARTSQPARLEVPSFSLGASSRPFARVDASRHFAGGHVNQTTIFREDLELSGTSVFHKPVKVGGDLAITGNALFLAPVVVNGTLKVTGTAHFSAGIIVKDDALVRGSLKVGSSDAPGWAVLRDLLLGERLSLNGTVVAKSAVQLKEAA